MPPADPIRRTANAAPFNAQSDTIIRIQGRNHMSTRNETSTRSELLKLFTDKPGEYISGQSIAEKLGISRNSVWKAVSALKKEGYIIDARRNRGYRLVKDENLLTRDGILPYVSVPCDIEVFDCVTSTNSLAKDRELDRRAKVIIANRQSKGRGRLGRNFESPGGTGIYLTIALKPSFTLEKSLYVTMAVAVAVSRAIERVCNTQVQIKWVNDLFKGTKKICGILTEAQTNFETGKIDSLIIGIGVNCFPGEFSADTDSIAGSISETGGSFSRNMLAAAIIDESIQSLNNVEDKNFFDDYRQRCMILGKKVTVNPNYDTRGFCAEAIDISDDGGLIVRFLEGPDKDMTRTLHTGEVSVRFNGKR